MIIRIDTTFTWRSEKYLCWIPEVDVINKHHKIIYWFKWYIDIKTFDMEN